MAKYSKNKNKACSTHGCDRPAKCRGMCANCYNKAIYNKTIKTGKSHKPKVDRRCITEGCAGKHFGRGYCRKCYNQLLTTSTVGKQLLDDLPGEEWKKVESHHGIFISNMGRLKSSRNRIETPLKQRYGTVNPQERQNSMLALENIRVHMEVLRAFVPNTHGDNLCFFRDGNRRNCKADNLAWYGEEIMLPKAIAMAEESKSKWADCFLLFWHGQNEMLDHFWEEMRQRLGGFLHRRTQMFSLPFDADVDDCVQETLFKAFMAIKRGLIQDLDKVTSWIFAIAKKILASKVKYWIPVCALTRVGDNGGEFDVADYAGWCHPSAELAAIYREDILN